MVFNTGAALLDAVVLAVVSKEKEGTYGIRSRRMCVEFWMFRSLLCIRFYEDSRKINAWKCTICSLTAETDGTIR